MLDVSAKRTGVALTERQKISWLRLIRSDNVGPVTFRDLINHFGTAEAALDALPELSRRGAGARTFRVATTAEAERELEIAHRLNATFIGIGEPNYPFALRQIDGAPPLIAVKGDLNAAMRPSLGVVGSRNASASGAKFAAMIARDAGCAGYVITSGLARGIDTSAHRASLESGTIAVLAGGIDRPYPPENVGLLHDIMAGSGLAVSEMPFGWEPRARDFPRRNRLIAGISLGVAIVEAANRSGSLITARYAADFGRLVFAVPGSPLDPRCHGTNDLLKQGAIVTTTSDDVLDGLAPLSQHTLPFPAGAGEPAHEMPSVQPPRLGDGDRATITDALGPTPVEIDDVIRHTGLPAAEVYLALIELDLAGRLNRHPSGLVSLSIEQ
ncbi:DNA-protecting protein DprA [Ensifer sp. HO-A22]|uniref:DNA-protecting protein DprA n=1 Tax=Ensifer oleiphilus TaxID=2742698 RepID=A0A7Y6Q3R3_9HYPH|nr:DNA-processing protein DprA [Ensifer oleiphilus]NVD38509.1 DNA-protecting protein DprA [Ensifer oleiphilus]